ncbi:RDD family protein [Patiriisocius sp. Uisw_017]|jgi:uncharacterized RDD family membrane protein YckC|uniref:RDD family protein n=1 Tax=Patiriisocius sp. Uisw_017 TaxID=3230968 RepID=UPI0039EAA023
MDNFQIETAQNINISQQVAGVGHRVLAFIVDLLIIAAYVLVMSFIFSNLDMFEEEFSIVVGATIGLPVLFYHLLWETLWDGKSPGKASLKMKVVNIDGSKPDFSNFLIRWVLRTIDISICSGSVALFVVLLNGKGQRLGDIAARTTVISEREPMSLARTILTSLPDNYEPTYPQVAIFTDAEMQDIKNIYQDARRNARHKVILKLAIRVSKVMNVTFQEKPIRFIDTVVKDFNFYTQQ